MVADELANGATDYPETNKSINDKTTVFYNAYITIRDMTEEAYAYVVNRKPALEWVMERKAVTTDRDSSITNDTNLWVTETMGNPKYPSDFSSASPPSAWRR